MDPTACLQEALMIASAMTEEGSESIDTGDAVRLAELLLALNSWIQSGGFLPRMWEQK